MKNILATIILTALAGVAVAQQQSPEPDTLNTPNKQTDPPLKQMPEDVHYVDERVRITADELPQPVLDSLKAAEPTAWEKSVVYKDKQENFFIVEVREAGHEEIYRFDNSGRRLKNIDDDKKRDEGGPYSGEERKKR